MFCTVQYGDSVLEMGFRVFCLVPVFLLAEHVLANVRLLSCHSVNVISDDRPTEYVFIPTKREDCTFVFEGPRDTKLDMEVRSVLFPKMFTETENCRKSKLTIYNYIDSKFILGKLICNENEKANLLTKSNMGIVTSSLTDGSFSIKIRPKTEGADPPRAVAGMQPPHLAAEDYYFLERGDDLVNEGFKPITGTFRPSVPLHHSPYTDYKAKPFVHQPHRPAFYPGRPTEIIDITYNATGHNFTIVTHKPTTPAAPEETTTNRQPEPGTSHPSSVKPAENATTSAGITSQEGNNRPSIPGKPTTPGQPTPGKPTTPEHTTTVLAQPSTPGSMEHVEEE